LSGLGSLALIPRGDLDLSVDVENVNLARISEFSGVDLQLKGTAKGQARVKVAKADFANPSNWSGAATLQAAEVRRPGLYAPHAEATFTLADKTVTFERFS